MRKQPQVSVIIINWNGLEDTFECLNSLKKIDYSNYKIIVIDNGSKNKEGNRIRKKFPKIKLIKNKKNEGFCKANNQGIKLAIENNSDYVLLLNNDTIVTKKFLKKMVIIMEKDKKIGISSPSILYPNSNIVWSNGGIYFPLIGIAKMIDKSKDISKARYSKPNFLTGCCMLIRKEILEKVGYLDNNYFAYIEDVDYSFRIQKLGYKIKIIKSAVIYHKKSASAGISGSNKVSKIQAYLQMRNSIYFIKKHSNTFFKRIFIFLIILFKGSHLLLNLKNFIDIKFIWSGIKDGIKK